MEFRASIATVLEDVCFAFASRVSPVAPRTSRKWRRLIRFVNHDFLNHLTSMAAARKIYARLEPTLNWDWQYWLQRGSLEVEDGNLNQAGNFLDQARSLAGGQRTIDTEYAYLLTKKAATDAGNTQAPEWFEEGRAALEGLIAASGRDDSYPYHILGSQGLAWIHHANLPLLEERALLRHLIDVVEAGVTNHPHNTELPLLLVDLRQEWLSTAVNRE